MIPYIFVLGRTPELAFLELQSFFPSASLLTETIAAVDGQTPEESVSPVECIGKLGGTVKIGKALGEIQELTAAETVHFLSMVVPEGSFTFGISVLGPWTGSMSKLLPNVKEVMESGGRHVRFVLPRNGMTLSSVVVAKEKMVELLVVPLSGKILIAHTQAVQPFESWGERDYGRPEADAKAGMLPPKVARMAVNIAQGFVPNAHRTLLDPFCGMGTILSEALLAGWHVIGADLSPEAVDKARDNIMWLAKKEKFITPALWNIMTSDATHISEKVAKSSVGAIVTEPFMGSTELGADTQHRFTPEKVKNILKGLEKLYIGCLKDWRSALADRGIVIIALPEFMLGDRVYFVKRVVDSCENFGYTRLRGPLEYSRPNAIVKRKFFVFQKK